MVNIIDEINGHKNVKTAIKGEVVIRPFRIRDAFKMKKWGKYKDLRFDHYNFPYISISDIIMWYYYKRGYFEKKLMYAAINNDDELVGYCILKNRNRKYGGDGELGVSFDTNRLNHGYGTSAIKQFIDVCFNDAEVDRIWLETAAFNVRALKCYKKAGFKIFSFSEREFEDQLYAEKIYKNYNGFNMRNGILYTHYYFMDITRKRYLNELRGK